MRRGWIIGLAVGLGLGQVSLAQAVLSGSAPEHVERGYAHLTQAHGTTASAARERFLSLALAAFKAAYQAETALPTAQVQALIGAAQAYLLVQSPRRVFPFLWQATPLQRAAKTLQQALVLQPDNAAAALLLGIVYRQQATQAAGQQPEALARSQHYLTQAAAWGLPLQLPPLAAVTDTPGPGFNLGDTILALRYLDIQGLGSPRDLIFIYRSAARKAIFGSVVTGQQAHPLSVIPDTGALASEGLLEAISTIPQPDERPLLVIHLRQGQQATGLTFLWDGRRFMPLPTP